MSAEVLREAAALMRERAEGSLMEPWRNDFGRVNADVSGYGVALVCEPVRKGDSAHIAGMHPVVALAVADWLEGVARYLERGKLPMSRDLHAIAAARAYLGRDA